MPLGCPVRPGNKALQVEFGDGNPSLITVKIEMVINQNQVRNTLNRRGIKSLFFYYLIEVSSALQDSCDLQTSYLLSLSNIE